LVKHFCRACRFEAQVFPENSSGTTYACHENENFQIFNTFRSLIQTIPRELIFDTDESMIDMKKIHKTDIKGGEAISIEGLGNKIPHISVMFAHSAEGATIPLLVILLELQHAPVNMEAIRASSKAWLASSKKGW
jgi:hypothetical protein